MSRVLITGGLGFIGSEVAKVMAGRGWDVSILDDQRASVVGPEEFAGQGVDLYLRSVQLHLTRRNLQGYDLCVHCASPVGAVGILSQAGRIAGEIVGMTQALVDACIVADVPLINISSSEVYGFAGLYTESDALVVPAGFTPRLEYAAGKIAAEQVVANSHTRGLSAITLRPFNVAGPRQASSKGFVLPTFVEQALAGEGLTVFGDGTQERAFTAVGDLAEFIADLTDEPRDRYDGCALNIGAPANTTSIGALAKRVIKATGSESKVRYTDGKAVHGEAYEEAAGHTKLPSIERAAEWGWKPKTTLPVLVRECVDHHLAAAVA